MGNRSAAAIALGGIGPEAKSAVPALAEVLDDINEEETVQRDAEAAIRSIGHAAVPTLTALLKDKDEGVRGNAARALGIIGPEAETAIPDLTRMVTDKDAGYRDRLGACYAFGKIGPAAKAAIPAITEMLKDRYTPVREAAAESLGEIGPTAKPAIPALTELLKDKKCRCSQGRGRSLGKDREGKEIGRQPPIPIGVGA